MSQKVQELPLQVGEKLILRFCQGEQEVRAISQIVGFRRGGFIIIDEPKLSTKDPSILACQIICAYSYEGSIFFFPTRIKKNLGEGLSLIDYPGQFQQKALRKHQRIQVKQEVGISLIDEERKMVRSVDDLKSKAFKATMVDISEGGCRLMIRSFNKIDSQTPCELEFALPDGQRIDRLKAIITGVRQVDEFTIEAGVQFRGPMDQIGKIFFFCQLALSIKNVS